MCINPDMNYFPTQEDIKSISRILNAKKYGIKKIYALAYPPDEEATSWGDALPEMSFFAIYDKTNSAGNTVSKYTIGSELENRINKSPLGDRWWIYVTAHPEKELNSEIETIRKNEAGKIDDGAVLIWPLDQFETESYENPDMTRPHRPITPRREAEETIATTEKTWEKNNEGNWSYKDGTNILAETLRLGKGKGYSFVITGHEVSTRKVKTLREAKLAVEEILSK